MALHFSTERPEDQFYTDFGNFNKFGEEVRTRIRASLARLDTGLLYNLLLCFQIMSIYSTCKSPYSMYNIMQAFSKLGSLIFNFLVDPQQVNSLEIFILQLLLLHGCFFTVGSISIPT